MKQTTKKARFFQKLYDIKTSQLISDLFSCDNFVLCELHEFDICRQHSFYLLDTQNLRGID